MSDSLKPKDQNDVARHAHTHVFQIAVVPHHVLDELVTGGTVARAHSGWRDAVRQFAR